MIGSANWIITLGRFDIAYAIKALSWFNMQPREGHLKAVKHVFGYLKAFPKGRIIIDPNYHDWDQFESKEYDNWKELYPDAEEDKKHPKMPELLGKMA